VLTSSGLFAFRPHCQLAMSFLSVSRVQVELYV
jgi:hypothetical protein